MNKKLVLGIGVIAGICLLGEVAHAEELKEALTLYLEDSSLDFLGHDFEKILFNEIQNSRNGMYLDDNEFIAKLKFVVDDIKTMPLQLKAYHKIFTNKVNAIAYGSLGGLAGMKTALGGEEFSKMIFKIIKLGMR